MSGAAKPAEPILEPDRPICDAHHHLWDREGSHYLLPQYLNDTASGHNIVSSVFIECGTHYRSRGPEALRAVGEVEFADAAATEAASQMKGSGICSGIVGFADLTLGARVEEVIDAHRAASPLFKGVRHCAAYHDDPGIRPAAHSPTFRGMLSDPAFREGFGVLGRRGLSFDAWVYHSQLGELASLANAFPETTIILDHLGGPIGIGPYKGRQDEVFAEWKAGLSDLASCPNVVIKLGGICMPINGWGLHRRSEPVASAELASLISPYVLHAIDSFGTGRCIFESNYPADRSSVSYPVLWNSFKRIVASFSDAEKDQLFHDNAAQIYRLVTTEHVTGAGA